jgi:hypothetical protein
MLEWLEVFSIEYIIRCEATHFLFSAFLGYVGYWLMLTILSNQGDRYTFTSSLLFGVCISVTTHMFIDWFTCLA